MNKIQSDHFKTDHDGCQYAGDHTLVELWGAKHLTDVAYISASLRDAALNANATILHDHYHHFGGEQGVSGVVILAESHISIHTWPERGYAAIDIFMCGDCDPNDAVTIIKQRFLPTALEIKNIRRGALSQHEAVA